MNKNCKFDSDDIIARYQLGILEANEEKKVVEHLNTCEICRHTLSELEMISEGLRLTKVEKLPENFKAELHDRLIEEQKILYSDSDTEPKKTKMDIFREIFPIRRFIPIAAVLAVVLLLTGRFGGPNILNNNTADDEAENMPIAVNRVNSDAAQEFRAYNSADVENQADNADLVVEKSDSDTEAVGKIPNNNVVNESNDITVAMDVNSDIKDSDSSAVVEKKVDITETIESKSAPLNAKTITADENSGAESVKEKSMTGGSSGDRMGSGGSSAASGSGSASGGGGGSLSATIVAPESNAPTSISESPMAASLEYYVNVYSVDSSVIENSEYAKKVINVNGEKTMYLSNSEYMELCEKLGVTPSFKETRIVEELNGYSVIIVVE